MEAHIKMKAAIETYIAENDKFEGGNKAAGTRARKALMEIKNLAGDRRKEIQEAKKDQGRKKDRKEGKKVAQKEIDSSSSPLNKKR